MNSTYKILSITCLISFFIVSACNDSILNKSNPNELSPETFFESEAQLRDATNVIYACMQSKAMYARQYFFSNDLMAQECEGLGSLGGDLREYIDYTWTSSNANIKRLWDIQYQGIHKANFVIGNADRVPEAAISDAQRKQFLGEAKFLRANYYFELVTRWGDIPLLKEIATSAEGLPRSPASEVWALIQEDLNDAANNLLMTKDALGVDNLGRATKGAAYALKGKVHLFRRQYQEAADAFAKVSGYSLMDNYFDNFMEETEHNSESIFEVQFNGTYGGSGSWGDNANGVAEVTFRSQEYGFNAWRNVVVSQTLLNEFEANDPRIGFNFYQDGDLFNNEQDTIKAFGNVADDKPNWKKYQQQYGSSGSNTASGINFRIIRYADVLLMWAEALNELDQRPLAIEKMNMVRNRPTVMMPNYGTPEMDAIYPVGTKLEVFNAIVHERQVELCGEQARYRDIQRWGIAKDVVPNYVVGKHEFWPLPITEIDANEAISSADQNPGF